MTESQNKTSSAYEGVKRKKTELQMEAVFKIVNDNRRYISSCCDKDVVVIVGPTQVGKSTVINALRFGQLKKIAKGRGKYDFVLPESASIETSDPDKCAAKVGDGSRSCTILPWAYTLDNGLVLVDTRGFFDSRLQSEDDAAASVLMECVVREAHSVRIVLLTRCNEFFKGVIGTAESGKVLGNIISGNQESIMFLFNDYPESPGEMEGMSPEKRQLHVMNMIREEYKEIKTDSELDQRKYDEKIAQLYSQAATDGSGQSSMNVDELIKKDEEVLAVKERRKYLQLMEVAFSKQNTKGSVAYIDPTDDFSILSLKQDLQALQPATKKYIKFGSTEDVRLFRKYLGESAGLHNSVLTGQKYFLRYPVLVVSKALESKRKSCTKHKDVLEHLSKCDEEQLVQYETEYKCDVLKQKADALKNERDGLTKRLEVLQATIKQIRDAEPEVYCSDSWCENGVFSNEHVVRYPPGKDVPFVRYEENLDAGFGEKIETKVISENPEDFEIHYSSSRGVGKILTNIGGLATAVAGVALSGVTFGVGLPVAMAGGAAVGGTMTKHCSGTVNFYVNPKDVPEIAAKIGRLEDEIKVLNAGLGKLEERMSSLLKSSTATLNERVSSMLMAEEEEVRILENFLVFAERVNRLYQKRFEKMTEFFKVVEGFYPGDQSFGDFVSLFKDVVYSKIEIEVDAAKIPFSELDSKTKELQDLYGRFFPDLWK